jgi:hypothetical protein
LLLWQVAEGFECQTGYFLQINAADASDECKPASCPDTAQGGQISCSCNTPFQYAVGLTFTINQGWTGECKGMSHADCGLGFY